MRPLLRSPLMLVVACVLTGAAAVPGLAQGDQEAPGWVVPPGKEAAITRLLAPYMDAPGLPRVPTATVKRGSILATVVWAEGQEATLELQHADTGTTAELPPDRLRLAAAADVDLRVMLKSPAPTAQGLAVLQTVAAQILANRRADPQALWVENSVRVDARRPAPVHGQRPTHRGILTPGDQVIASYTALATGAAAGVWLAIRRRRRRPGATSSAPE